MSINQQFKIVYCCKGGKDGEDYFSDMYYVVLKLKFIKNKYNDEYGFF